MKIQSSALRGLGVAEDKIAAVAVGAASGVWSDLERLVLGYADCLIIGLGRVPDEIFDGLRAELPDDQLLELTYITTLYAQHAVMSKALRTEFDDVDDRIVEVDAPLDFDARDIVRDISLPDHDPDNEDDQGAAR